ncbi:threonylcarbamoyl-AMP synthase [Candidatus Saccharibacteria bacterium]|nr:threonylcarbamoyl-AMP synthase [Candidatus Saccharibacteria bacterium]
MRKILPSAQKEAIEVLDKGGILAIPTETVFGLAVKLDNTPAIRKLLELKKRDKSSGKMLTLMVADTKHVSKYAEVTPRADYLMRRYFPGELTLVLPKQASFRHPYFDNFDTIGVRIPDHEFSLELLRATGPLLVTSANLRGESPCTRSAEIIRKLPKVDGVIKGVSGNNLPSTIIDLTDDQPETLRQGGLLIVRFAA